jgi:hypothetical protein
MRRVIAVLAAILLGTSLTVSPAAAPVAAAEPGHGTGGISFDYSFPAGDLCPFAVRWVEDGTRMQALTFPVRPNGDQLTRYAGPQWSTVTNLATHASMVVGGGLRLDWISHQDGTADVQVDGTVVAGHFPGDAAEGFWVFHGRLHDTVGTNGWTTTAHSFNGRAVDLCAALAG